MHSQAFTFWLKQEFVVLGPGWQTQQRLPGTHTSYSRHTNFSWWSTHGPKVGYMLVTRNLATGLSTLAHGREQVRQVDMVYVSHHGVVHLAGIPANRSSVCNHLKS